MICSIHNLFRSDAFFDDLQKIIVVQTVQKIIELFI